MDNKKDTKDIKGTEEKGILHTIDQPKMKTSLSTPILIGIIVVAIVLGVGTGFGISKISGSSMQASNKSSDKTDGNTETSAGVLDKKTFKDQAEGVLKEGGFEGEGSYHLDRPGGDDQNAYLTSSAVDLSKFVGKKVRVWGQTFEAEKAGWLMDVGYVEVIK